MPTFVFDPASSDLVTFTRLRIAKCFEKGEQAWVAWVDRTDACSDASRRGETDPTKIFKKDGYLPCDTVEEAQVEVDRLIKLETRDEPADFLARIEQAPGDAFAIAVEMSTRYFESKKKFCLLWPEGGAVYRREGTLGTFDHSTFDPEALFEKFEAKDRKPFDALALLDDYVIYNPFKKTKAKEPVLLFISHEGGEAEPVFGGDLGVSAVFLRYLAHDVLGERS